MNNVNIRRYRYGAPFDTEAAVVEQPCEHGKPSRVEVRVGSPTVIAFKLEDDDRVLGLGEALGPQNRRSRIFESWCSDEPDHTPDKKALYGAHPYLIVDGAEPFALWVDFPGRIRFDVGHTRRDEVTIEIGSPDFNLWMFENGGLPDLVRAFRRCIGKPYVPPKWGFGYQQSRWSYPDAAAVREVAEQFRRCRLPIDSIYLDIDYMERFKDFTVDPASFPDMEAFVREMKEEGIRLIPIIDAGVKIEEGYPVYEEGVSRGYFCTDCKGKPFVAAVWPGRVHFPDFLDPEARRWFGDWYRVLLDMGFEGFWNDMNEPAIFYTDDGINKALDAAHHARGENLDIYSFFALRHVFEAVSNRAEDYGAMHHRVNGELVSHEKVHNLYGMNMTRAAAEGFEDFAPGRRVLMFSRASAIGAHRYGGIWTGDNHSWWEHLLLNVRMMPAINYCGFLYSGADTGGFADDVSPELLIRWFQFSLFTPLFRNHAIQGSRQQEPYAFEESALNMLRGTLELRYALIPWLYSEFLKAVESDEPMFRPLAWHYRDNRSVETDDQLLFGDALMLSPVVQPGVRGRTVWLPESMALWRACDASRFKWEICPAGDHYVELSLGETPVFLRPNHMLALAEPAKRVEDISTADMRVAVYLTGTAESRLLDDDGASLPLENAGRSELVLRAQRLDGAVHLIAEQNGSARVRTVHWTIITPDGGVEEHTTSVVNL